MSTFLEQHWSLFGFWLKDREQPDRAEMTWEIIILECHIHFDFAFNLSPTRSSVVMFD